MSVILYAVPAVPAVLRQVKRREGRSPVTSGIRLPFRVPMMFLLPFRGVEFRAPMSMGVLVASGGWCVGLVAGSTGRRVCCQRTNINFVGSNKNKHQEDPETKKIY